MLAGEEPSREPEQAPQEAAGPEEARPQESGAQAVPLGALPTGDLLVWFLGLLAAKAWEGMGLVPNPATNKVQKNLLDARMAIDAYAALFEAVRAHIEDQPRREMETVLTTLRLNFVEKSTA